MASHRCKLAALTQLHQHPALPSQAARVSLISLMPVVFFKSTEPSRFHFYKPENYISMYHQEGSDTLYVGGQAMIYVLTFTNRGVDDVQVTKSTFQLIPRSEGIQSAELQTVTPAASSNKLHRFSTSAPLLFFCDMRMSARS